MVSISKNPWQNGGVHKPTCSSSSSTTTSTSPNSAKRQSLLSFLLGVLCSSTFMYRIREPNWECPSKSKSPAILNTEELSSRQQLRKSVPLLPNTTTTTATNIAVATETTDKDKQQQRVDDWKWYEGDVNQYYNELEKDIKRDPNNIDNYAVHRWMGPNRSTKVHYELLLESIVKYTGRVRDLGVSNLNVLDAGCGLGSALMYMESHNPSWTLQGRTLSEEQVNFVNHKLPAHKFSVELGSYNELPEGALYDAIYSIEAMIHSTDIHATLQAWAQHLHPQHGSIVVIDDFLMPGADKDEPEMQNFRKGWMANAFYTVTELSNIGRKYGLELVESRDLLAEYRVIELNYRNQPPNLNPDGARTHQGWMGSKWRHKLTVEGKIAYNMIVFQRVGAKKDKYRIAAGSSPNNIRQRRF